VGLVKGYNTRNTEIVAQTTPGCGERNSKKQAANLKQIANSNLQTRFSYLEFAICLRFAA
jgi:hypothetical protein